VEFVHSYDAKSGLKFNKSNNENACIELLTKKAVCVPPGNDLRGFAATVPDDDTVADKIEPAKVGVVAVHKDCRAIASPIARARYALSTLPLTIVLIGMTTSWFVTCCADATATNRANGNAMGSMVWSSASTIVGFAKAIHGINDWTTADKKRASLKQRRLPK